MLEYAWNPLERKSYLAWSAELKSEKKGKLCKCKRTWILGNLPSIAVFILSYVRRPFMYFGTRLKSEIKKESHTGVKPTFYPEILGSQKYEFYEK